MRDEDAVDPAYVLLGWSFGMTRSELAPDAVVALEGLTPAEQRAVDELVRLELDVRITAADAELSEARAVVAAQEAALIYLRSVSAPGADEATAVAGLTPTQELIYSALLPSRRGPEASA